MITISRQLMDAVFDHGREGYPHEVCGIFLGTFEGENKRVVEVRRAKNLNTERAHDRYNMDPKDVVMAEKEGRERGLEILGFYHSHPDHPNEPSEHDRELAVNAFAYVYSFLIVAVKEGKEVIPRSWVLNDKTDRFDEEKIETAGD